jgi:hypothetical protein
LIALSTQEVTSSMQKPPASKLRLRQAILRSVASSTAIETGRSIVSIERKLQQKSTRPATSKPAR